jgi:hypothetical protein
LPGHGLLPIKIAAGILLAFSLFVCFRYGDALLSPLWPGAGSIPRERSDEAWLQKKNEGGALALVLVFALVVAGLKLKMPLRERRLVAIGAPVRGVLTDKTKGLGHRRVNWWLHFEFEGSSSSRHFTGKQQVRPVDWKRANVGESYTILYDPRRPDVGAIYAFVDYEAV